MKNKEKLTTYKGFYWADRDGKRVGIEFTYQIKDGKMINEEEISVKEKR